MSIGAPASTALARAPDGSGSLAATRPSRSRRRRVLAGALVGCASLAVIGCGGGGEDEDTVQRKVITTDAGTVIVRSVTDREALKVEVQSDSVYVAFTDDTPGATREMLRGKPLGGRCKLADGRQIGTIQLLWRDDPGDWGSNLGVQGVYEGDDALPQEIRSCELRRGEAAAGGTDINAGPVLATVSFED